MGGGGKIGAYSVLCGETKTSLGRRRGRQEENIKLDLRGKELEREVNLTYVSISTQVFLGFPVSTSEC